MNAKTFICISMCIFKILLCQWTIGNIHIYMDFNINVDNEKTFQNMHFASNSNFKQKLKPYQHDMHPNGDPLTRLTLRLQKVDSVGLGKFFLLRAKKFFGTITEGRICPIIPRYTRNKI